MKLGFAKRGGGGGSPSGAAGGDLGGTYPNPTVISVADVTTGVLTATNGGTGLSSLGAGVATFLGTPSSANLLAAVSDETGSGSLVFATSPTLVTPVLGVATATSINKVAITAPATSATLTLTDGKTLSVTNSLTLSGTDGTTLTFPTTSDTIPGLAQNNVFTANGGLSSGVGPGLKLTGTWITGGSATTTKPYVHIEVSGATTTAWSTNGTGLGVNSASGFTGNLIDLQQNGSSRFTITGAGVLSHSGGTATFNSGLQASAIAASSGSSFGINNSNNISTASRFSVTLANGSTHSQTSGTNGALQISPTYNQSSGTAANTDLLINRTQTAVGSGAQLLIDAQVGGSSKFSVSNTGVVVHADVPRFNGTNTTGAGATALGTNCPAVTATAPYTWIQVTTSDGSTAYIPVWK